MGITALKTNNRVNPVVLNQGDVYFGWNIDSENQNIYQNYYRIEVWEEDGAIVWDSGQIFENKMQYIRYQGNLLEGEKKYCWKVTAECEFEKQKSIYISEIGYFGTGIFRKEDWAGSFIGEVRDGEYHIYRKKFTCKSKIKKAKIYICGLGHFELYINGSKISDYVLETAWSDYNKSCYYTGYDVTKNLKDEDNAAVIKLGDGMFHVPGGRYVYYERSYGYSKVLAKLVIDYENGKRDVVVTDSSWRKKKSPIKFCCIYGGEEFDGRLWNNEMLLPEYEETIEWSYAECVSPPNGELKAQIAESLKVMEVLKPISIQKLESGEILYDFGKNFSGWVRIQIKTNGKQSGKKIVMTPGEILGAEHLPDQRVTGKGYSWDYILNEKEVQEFTPDFTYTGFRYLAVEGAKNLVKSEKLDENIGIGEGEYSDIPEITSIVGEFIYPEVCSGGEFSCSNELYNQIHSIIKQAILSNTKSYFTDCPHREKLGWLEETHLIGPSVMYNLEVQALYEKIEGDICDAQRESGLVSDICPEYVTGFDKYHKGFVDSPEWGSAIIINAWYVYKRYGDSRLLYRYYENMKKYLNYLTGKTHHHVLHHGLGDWLDIGPMTPHSQNTPVPVVATCIYYYDLTIMKKIAEIVGKMEDTKEYGILLEKVKEEFNLQFLDDQTGRYATGSQTAQAMSLVVGLVPREIESKVINQLKNDIVKRGYVVTAGDVGHPFVVRALIQYGMDDILNKMLMITDKPGYGYQVVNGATTLTEEWDGPDPNRPHGSQNHFMLGSIEEWFFGSLGGVEQVHCERMIDEIVISPYFPEGMEWVKTWVMHPYGKVECNWKRNASGVEVQVTIPPCTTAYLKDQYGKIIKKVGSGRYHYQV